jgi:hypothetical protein
VEVFLSQNGWSYQKIWIEPEHAAYWGSSIAVANIDNDTMDEFAVGSEGLSSGKYKWPGAVYVYDFLGDVPEQIAAVVGDELGFKRGDRFGEDVAFGNVSDQGFEIVVGAPGRSNDRINDAGEVWLITFSLEGTQYDVTDSGLVTKGWASDEKIGSAVSGTGIYIVGTTSWYGTSNSDDTGFDTRAEVYENGSWTANLRPSPGPGQATGWATSGVYSGDIDDDNKPDWIIGAPNVSCGSSNSSGVVYLYLSRDIYASRIAFRPPTPDPDWAAFGWDARIITSDGGNFVIVGEPGRDDDVNYAFGRVYIYRYTP